VAIFKLEDVVVALEYITNKLVMVLTAKGVEGDNAIELTPRTMTCTSRHEEDAYNVPVPSPGVPCITALSSSAWLISL
jgi:hypothetical protein